MSCGTCSASTAKTLSFSRSRTPNRSGGVDRSRGRSYRCFTFEWPDTAFEPGMIATLYDTACGRRKEKRHERQGPQPREQRRRSCSGSRHIRRGHLAAPSRRGPRCCRHRGGACRGRMPVLGLPTLQDDDPRRKCPAGGAPHQRPRGRHRLLRTGDPSPREYAQKPQEIGTTPPPSRGSRAAADG